MNDPLNQLVQHKLISPLNYFFAQFISEQSGESIDSLLCLTAALISHRNEQGDVSVNFDELSKNNPFINSIEGIKTIVFPPTKEWIEQLKQYNCIGCINDFKPLIIENESIYLGKLWHYEDFIVKEIKRKISQPTNIDTSLLQTGINTLFNSDNESIDWQKVAASLVVLKSFSVISGGPGTGKTTTLVKILALILEQNPNYNIQLCAPTGKAAIRMLEAINAKKDSLNLAPHVIEKIPNEAKTIHRLLKYRQGRFLFNQNKSLSLDCIVIDEASMIDFELMFHLMNALPKHCQIIFMGDKDQLSSVDAGHVFSDLCGRGQSVTYSQTFAHIIATVNKLNISQLNHAESASHINDSIALLKTSYRFTHDSLIGRLAGFVNQGEGNQAIDLMTSENSETSFIELTEETLPSSVIDILIDNYQSVVITPTIEEAFKAFNRFQLLCAVHVGPFGTKSLNELINQRLHLRHKLKSQNHFNGQPIIITKNDYQNNLFNGDIGLVWEVDNQQMVYFQQIDGVYKSYPLMSIGHYELAWAITVHKSQGSEYDSVLLALPTDIKTSLIKRELIYTGITRAKSHFTLVADKQFFIQSCKSKTLRSSGLAKKLGW